MAGAGTSPRRHITDLPVELQKTIFRNSSLVDLASLAVVSKHFHSIATAQLYRKLSINFNIGPGPFCRGHEAEAQLDAIVTSTHDNAQHLKKIFVDVAYSWMAPPNVTYDVTPCAVAQGHYLSTLLLLTLRKAKALEVFHWNARLKISQEVFEQLHSLSSLRKLHVRHRDPLSEFALTNPAGSSPVLTLSLLPNPQTNEPAGTMTWKAAEKKKRGTKDSSKRPFKSFSGFRHLTSLAVLNLSSRDHVSEIASCVRACSSTLEDFKLSLSPTLAMKAQEPPPVLPAESDTDDDEDVEIPLPPPAATLETTEVITALVPPNQADRAAERAAQQEILDQIFKSEDSPSVAPTVEANPAPKVIRDPIPKLSLEKVTALVNRLLEISGKVDLGSVAAELPLSEVLRKVAQVIEELDPQEKGTLPNEDDHPSNVTPTAKPEALETSGPAGTTEGLTVDGEPSPANVESTDGLNHLALAPSSMQAMYENAAKELRGPSSSLSSSGHKVTKTPSSALAKMNMTPEDIDIDHPDVEVDDSDDEDDETATQEKENGDRQGMPDIILVPNRSPEVHPGEVTMSGGLGHTVPTHANVEAAGAATQQGGPVSISSPMGKHEPAQPDVRSTAPEVAMKEYIRSTRKFAFRSFGLYLVPLRAATVLGAIEVPHLSHITLLSVGNQTGFWNVMSTMNQTTPVRLRSVFTDDVTMTFLRFAGEVQDLSELFLLRRVRKSTNQSSNYVYSPTIKDIRREVLKKHARRLTKVHLKNLNDREWDVDENTIQLLAKRGRALEEFGCSLSLKNFHNLLQSLPRLRNLRALHIIKLHLSSFTAEWSPREILDFVMDTVTQHSRMRLEYVAAESEVVRVERKPKRTTTTKPKRSGLAGVLVGFDSSSDEVSSDVDASDPSSRSRQTVVSSECGGLSETKGVRIFNQDLLTGAL